MKNIYDDSGNNNAPDYENDLVFPPEEHSMPRCDIEELKQQIKKLEKIIERLKDEVDVWREKYLEALND